MQQLQWYIGCSWFYYKEWKELFYPKGWPQKQWFEYYCQHFNTLEVNNTFYRFPEVSNLQSWFQRSPENFIFTVKATKTITHLKPFTDTEAIIQDFYATIKEGFSSKLGSVLFQLPPRLEYSEATLEKIILQLDTSFLNVLEFRHPSWWNQEVYRKLQAHHIVFSGISYPDLPNDVVSNTDTLYYRFHGLPKLYFSSYDPAFLRHVALLIKDDQKVKKAFLYFNNTAAAGALDNAAFIKAFIAGNETKYLSEQK